MKNAQSQFSFFRPASFRASGVAILLAFLLATHAFWCGLAGSACESDIAPSGFVTGIAAQTSAVASIVTHAHLSEDICAGVDEAKTRALAIVSAVPAPTLIWVALIFVAVALTLPALAQRAAVFGRDGPVRVPPLVGRLVRASLPHRAPPVFLT